MTHIVDKETEYVLPYYAKVIEKICNGQGYWSSTRVGVFNNKDEQVGEYVRNFDGYNKETFYPFFNNGKWYALYSKEYTTSAIMSLPDCKEIWSEKPSAIGFCPTEFYVPMLEEPERRGAIVANSVDSHVSDTMLVDKKLLPEKWHKYFPNFGFVSGCVWGDDCSWKVEIIDWSDMSNIKRIAKFGYLELSPCGLMRDGIIKMYDTKRVIISTMQTFDI